MQLVRFFACRVKEGDEAPTERSKSGFRRMPRDSEPIPTSSNARRLKALSMYRILWHREERGTTRRESKGYSNQIVIPSRKAEVEFKASSSTRITLQMLFNFYFIPIFRTH